MADPNAVGDAFLSAYHSALDQNPATVGNFFQDCSTLSFEGETLQGKNAIVQKLTSLGLPPNPVRRVTAKDAQNSCCGNGAIVIFSTGEWMNNQYQEAFQLVPNGSGGYYIHNCVFRLGLNNAFNVPGEAQELIKGFIQHYYSNYDGGLQSRDSLRSVYGPQSIVNYEGTVFVGVEPIMEKFRELPMVQHDPNMACDVQLVNGLDIVFIFLCGQMSIDGTNPMKFAQLFLIQKQGGAYMIGNQVFRLNYG